MKPLTIVFVLASVFCSLADPPERKCSAGVKHISECPDEGCQHPRLNPITHLIPNLTNEKMFEPWIKRQQNSKAFDG